LALHPQVESIVTQLRVRTGTVTRHADIEERRSAYRELAAFLWPVGDDVAEVRDVTLPLRNPLSARLYVPDGHDDKGILLFFHGGAFVQGDLESHDAICRRIATATDMRLLAVAYRLAPEHPFPAAVDDAVEAARHVASHLDLYGNSADRVILLGDSAGAALAAHAAAATRGEGLPIVAQVLIYPTVGPDLITQSAHEFARHALLDVDDLRFNYDLYLGSGTDPTDPRVSLLMNLDLSSSPPAVIVVAECDPLRDEGIAYAGLLEHFGTRVRVLEAEGMVHGFLQLGGVVPEALAILGDLARELRELVHAS
jgi:acetyl esterase